MPTLLDQVRRHIPTLRAELRQVVDAGDSARTVLAIERLALATLIDATDGQLAVVPAKVDALLQPLPFMHEL